MKNKKLTEADVLNQIVYMCELWNKGMFYGLGATDVEDAGNFVDAIVKMTKAVGKTDRYVNKIMDKDLHLNG